MPIFKKHAHIRFIQWLFPLLENYFPPLAYWFACWLFLKPFRFAMVPQEKEVLKKADLMTLSVAGRKIRLYSWGEGPMTLFVHGWSGRGTNLWAFAEPIQKAGGRLVAFDAPGHGFSEGSRTNFLEFIEVVEAIRKEFGEPAAFIGHSLGGMAAYHLIEEKGIEAPLIMIASPSEETDIFRTFFRRLHGVGLAKDKLKQWVIKKTGFNFDQALPLYARPLKNPETLLLIHDEEDIDCSVEDSRKLHAANKSSELLITKGFGHLLILSSDQAVSKSLSFLEKHAIFSSKVIDDA